MRALIADYDFPDIELEREIFRTGGVEHATAQCRSEDDLIAAARECDVCSVLINTARGAVVDVDALRSALDEGCVDGAALDVLPTEPIRPDHPLAQHPRVLLIPHAAFYSAESEIELRRKAALNIVQWATTGRPMYPVVQGSRSPRSEMKEMSR